MAPIPQFLGIFLPTLPIGGIFTIQQRDNASGSMLEDDPYDVAGDNEFRAAGAQWISQGRLAFYNNEMGLRFGSQATMAASISPLTKSLRVASRIIPASCPAWFRSITPAISNRCVPRIRPWAVLASERARMLYSGQPQGPFPAGIGHQERLGMADSVILKGMKRFLKAGLRGCSPTGFQRACRPV